MPRVNNSYTVICSSGTCYWRLHAARLPDGITWAIKSIQNPEHTCIRLKTRNPMVNVKWAARVLMEDIRENNDIPAKSLNRKLFWRFRVEMYQSTLYRVKKLALMEIHGGPLMFSLFWKACGAYSPFTFRKAMEALKKTNPLALIWLSKLGEQSTWSKYAFNPSVRCDVNKTNFVESFNATLRIARCRPILTLLDGIRRVIMVRMATRRQMCEEWERDDLCPNIIKRHARNRRREEDEQRKYKRSKTVKCSICKEFGHNAATCKGGLTAKEKGNKNKKKGGESSQPIAMMDHGASTSRGNRTTAATKKKTSFIEKLLVALIHPINVFGQATDSFMLHNVTY
ncbi:Sec-independent protein translocase protein TatA [Bienertia sinuspersici]